MVKRNKIKQLYCGVFNFAREIFILYGYAFSEAQAREIFFRRLAKHHGVSIYIVRNHFDGSKDNFRITIEMEVKEDEI